jgi:hypothetical protein
MDSADPTGGALELARSASPAPPRRRTALARSPGPPAAELLELAGLTQAGITDLSAGG